MVHIGSIYSPDWMLLFIFAGGCARHLPANALAPSAVARVDEKILLDAPMAIYGRLVLQTSLKNFLAVNFDQFLGLDGPYLALLGPLLASPASGLTPSTCGNPVSTRAKQIFDQNYFCKF